MSCKNKRLKNSILSWKNFLCGSGWICLIVGIVCYLVYFLMRDCNSLVSSIAEKVGDVLVIGGVLGFVSNAAQFIGIFKADLQDTIYGREYLNVRNDLGEVWRNLSKKRFSMNMDGIEQPFLDVIENYFPDQEQEICYLKDYGMDYDITWIDEPKSGNIVITKTIFYTIETNSEKEFDHFLYSKVMGNNTENNLKEMKVNGKDYQEKDCGTDEKGRTVHKITLGGSTEYKISFKRIMKYNLQDDYFLSFKAHNIVQGMRVSLQLPKKLEAIYINRGTQHDFIKRIDAPQRKIYEYNGLVLPNQGFVFALSIVENEHKI